MSISHTSFNSVKLGQLQSRVTQLALQLLGLQNEIASMQKEIRLGDSTITGGNFISINPSGGGRLMVTSKDTNIFLEGSTLYTQTFNIGYVGPSGVVQGNLILHDGEVIDDEPIDAGIEIYNQCSINNGSVTQMALYLSPNPPVNNFQVNLHDLTIDFRNNPGDRLINISGGPLENDIVLVSSGNGDTILQTNNMYIGNDFNIGHPNLIPIIGSNSVEIKYWGNKFNIYGCVHIIPVFEIDRNKENITEMGFNCEINDETGSIVDEAKFVMNLNGMVFNTQFDGNQTILIQGIDPENTTQFNSGTNICGDIYFAGNLNIGHPSGMFRDENIEPDLNPICSLLRLWTNTYGSTKSVEGDVSLESICSSNGDTLSELGLQISFNPFTQSDSNTIHHRLTIGDIEIDHDRANKKIEIYLSQNFQMNIYTGNGRNSIAINGYNIVFDDENYRMGFSCDEVTNTIFMIDFENRTTDFVNSW